MTTVAVKLGRRFARSWKEHWDPNAPLVFLKHRRLGLDPNNPVVKPGDPVTPEMRAQIGKRLRVWWQARFVGRADMIIVKSQRGQEPPVKAVPTATPSPSSQFQQQQQRKAKKP